MANFASKTKSSLSCGVFSNRCIGGKLRGSWQVKPLLGCQRVTASFVQHSGVCSEGFKSHPTSMRSANDWIPELRPYELCLEFAVGTCSRIKPQAVSEVNSLERDLIYADPTGLVPLLAEIVAFDEVCSIL